MARRICTEACPLIWRACLRSLDLALAVVGSRSIQEGRRDSVGSSLASASLVPLYHLKSILSRRECRGQFFFSEEGC